MPSFAHGINNVNFHTHHSVYELMENENCLAHRLETAAMDIVIEGQGTMLTKISLTFSNLSQEFYQLWKHVDGPTLHPAVNRSRRYLQIL